MSTGVHAQVHARDIGIRAIFHFHDSFSSMGGSPGQTGSWGVTVNEISYILVMQSLLNYQPLALKVSRKNTRRSSSVIGRGRA
jgi:hypothetical protein